MTSGFFNRAQKLKEELKYEYDLDWPDDMRMSHVHTPLQYVDSRVTNYTCAYAHDVISLRQEL